MPVKVEVGECRPSSLVKSKSQIAKNILIKCPNCSKTFDRKFKLKAHMLVHEAEKPFSCTICNTGFKTNSALRRHIRELHDQTRMFYCNECGKHFNSKTNYVIHSKRHTLEFAVHCEHCNEGFVTKSEYRRHFDSKHNTKDYVCDTCGKTMSSERHLKEHRRIHEKNYEERYFQECSFCKKKFRHLKKHIREFHEGVGNNYICHTCGKSFRGENSLKVHLMIHKGERPYQCELCLKEFYSKQYLTVHCRIHTGEKPYECEFCGKGFAQKPPLKIHLRLHLGETPYECDVCDEKSYKEETNLQKHVQQRHKLAVLCDACGSEFKNEIFLKKHLESHGEAEGLKCNSCGRTFKGRLMLESHIKEHLNEPVKKCEKCEKPFFCLRKYRYHMKSKHNDAYVVCKHCGKMFANSASLNNHEKAHSEDYQHVFYKECSLCKGKFRHLEAHMRNCHQPVEKTATCETCGKSFRNSKTLKLHLATHETTKLYQCSLCGNTFSTSRDLNRHEKLHGGLSCIVCDKPFSKEAALELHLKRHIGEKDFKCTLINIAAKLQKIPPSKQKQCAICSKFFKDTRCLNKHMISHRTDRPFKCPECPKGFKRKHDVNIHMAVHGKHARFNCNFCSKFFKTKQSFLVHRSRHLKEYVATCESCSKGFVTKHEYFKHMNYRHGNNPNICDFCGRACYDKAALINHLKTHELDYNTEKFPCEICDKKFAQQRGLHQHFLRIHKDGGQRYVCDICGKKIHSKDSLKNHVNMHKGTKSIQCPQCNKTFGLRSTMKQHLLTHTGEKPHSCPLCYKCFTQRGPLKAHLNIHYGQKPFACELCEGRSDILSVFLQEYDTKDFDDILIQCPLCRKGFKNQKFLKKHMICHTDERPFVCPICNRAFKRAHEVKNHMISVHEQSRKFYCNQCPKVFKTKHGFIDHMNRHLKQFVAKCEECGRGFVTKQEYETHNHKKHNVYREKLICFVCGRTCVDQATLTAHLRTHEEGYHDAKYSCEHCGKKFAQKRGLDHHYVRKHKNGGERFICDLCGKEVNSLRSLKGHILIHKGLKPLQCPQCGKGFVLESTLKQHLLTHTGERPHKCEECGKCFTQRGPLKAHLRAHTGELPYVCEICSSAFISKPQLNSHIRSKHRSICDVVKPRRKRGEFSSQATKRNVRQAQLKARAPRLQKNSQQIGNNKLVEDRICQKVFTDDKKHIDEKPFICDSCNKCFDSEKQIKRHIIRVHEEKSKSFECEFCGLKLKTKGSLTTHNKRHLKQYVAECKCCKVGFVTNQEYINHMGSKHGPSNHVCNICGRPCYDKAALQGHMARHAKDYGVNSNIRCKICDKTFLQEKYLKHHFSRMHKNGGQRFICHLCGKKVNSKRSLRDHTYIHQGIKPLECKECGKSFGLRTTLKLHMRTHTGQRPYVCQICGKCFTQRTPLTVHMSLEHLSNPPEYRCEFCNKNYKDSKVLRVHIRNIHTNPKPRYECCKLVYISEEKYNFHRNKYHNERFERLDNGKFMCKFCEKLMKSHHAIIDHINSIHTKDNEYLCNICSAKYHSLSVLKNHMRKHSEHKSNVKVGYECADCGKEFTTPDALNAHQVSCHTEDYDKLLDGKFRCKRCPKVVVAKISMEEHVKADHLNEAYLCPSCGKGCFSMVSLKKHSLVHVETRDIQCVQCPKAFKSKTALRRHEKAIHKVAEFECWACAQTFEVFDRKLIQDQNLQKQLEELHSMFLNASANVEFNMDSDHKIRFTCEVCDYTAKHSLDFALHSKNHTEKYCCLYCTYKSGKEKNIEKHMRVHDSGTVTNHCTICFGVFSDKIQAEEHKNFHSGELPYNCQMCGKHFMFSWLLNAHNRYFDTSILNHLIYGPGISITPIKPEVSSSTSNSTKSSSSNTFLNYNNFENCTSENPFNGINNALLSKILEPQVNVKPHLDAFDGTCNELKIENNILYDSLLGTKTDFASIKIKQEPDIDRSNILDCLLDNKKPTRKRKEKPAEKPPAPVDLDEPIECDVCNLTFKNNVAFALHSIDHSKDKKYYCHLCDFKNTSKYHIEMHVRAHEGTTKYKCETCGKAFTISTHAIEHKYFHTGEKPFQCEICGKHFMFSWFLTSHRRTQHWEIVTGSPLVKYDCTICNKHYTSSTGLKRHNMTHHGSPGVDNSVLCDICGKRLSSKEKLKFHRRIHTGYKPFSCEICTKSFSRKEQLKEHERVHTGEKPYICKFCGKGFTQRSPLRIHERTHTGERPYTCMICQKGFISKGVMDTHMKTCSVSRTAFEPESTTRKQSLRKSTLKDPDFDVKVKLEKFELALKGEPTIKSETRKSRKGRKKGSKNREKVPNKVKKVRTRRGKHPPAIELDEPIECDLCNQTYKNNVAFAIHSLEHSEDSRYSCHLCEFKNASKYHIEMHVRAHEGTTKYKCEVCDKAFTVSTNAIEHKYFHTGEKPFQCEICGKHFMYSRFLASHRRTQHWEIMTGTPLVKYDCKICNKHYTSSSGLKRHNLRNHNTEGIDTSVLCDTCGKRISSKEKLKFHLRIHTGYKPFACEVCGKAFTDKERLKEHMRVHTGEKPFVCKYCAKSFTQRSPLKIHERTHTGEQPYICRLCSKGFVSKSAMDAHMKSCSALQIPSSNAGSHYLASNRGLSHICTVSTCKKMFGSRAALEAHLTSHVMPSVVQSSHNYMFPPEMKQDIITDQQNQLSSQLQELLERRQFAASLSELKFDRRDYDNNSVPKLELINEHPQDFTRKRSYVRDDDLVHRAGYVDKVSKS
ncbi:hypothetical protein HUJ04_003601 [Dendroctonus ponderosae]|nr:hypothetical protein HUJ04_003601 [Dendroctonus ponderosae]